MSLYEWLYITFGNYGTDLRLRCLSMSGSSLLPERVDYEEIKDNLGNSGWLNGVEFGLQEDLLLSNFIHETMFDEKFNSINKALLDDLDSAEKREVLDHVKSILKNAPEDSLLEYLKHGVPCTVKRGERRTFRLIDFENIENNIFVYGHEIKFPGKPENIKPDFTLFINGIPIAIIEAKPSTEIIDLERYNEMAPEEKALEQILRYEQQSPELFRYCQIGIAYGFKKLFIPTHPNWSREERFVTGQPWKVEKDSRTVKEDIWHLLRPGTLLKILRWYTFYRKVNGRLDKIVCRYNQFWAAEKALKRVSEYLDKNGDRNAGLIWHWQGSGKTYTMIYIANMFFEKYFERDPIVFFIVDRIDLQTQLDKNFIKGLVAPKFKPYFKVIESIEELKRELKIMKESEYKLSIIKRQIYVVILQKFRPNEFREFLKELGREYLEYLREANKEEYYRVYRELRSLSQEDRDKKLMELGSIKKKEVLLLIDEAHRSQYGLLASTLNNVFPNSIRLAFTGTPVFKFERNTFLEFAYPHEGEYYLDAYFIRDSIEDHFTLPLTYQVVQEGEIKEEGIRILLRDDEIKEYIERWIEASESEGGSVADAFENYLEEDEVVDEETVQPVVTRREIRQHLNHIKVFLNNERRIKKLAEYIAGRVEEDTENFTFKAMVVTASRRACVHMKKYLDEELQKRYGDAAKNWTEIVMTYQHNDTGEVLSYKENLIERWGKGDVNEINLEVQRRFKEEEDPKILIVTDMLITGFDAPILKVMYLDKPLYEHRLLQAIARVNRPYKTDHIEKEHGLIIDSVGLLKHVKESLKKYELIAEKRIAKDIEENVFRELEERVEEFKEGLTDLKEFLRRFSVGNRELNINVDQVKTEVRRDKSKALAIIRDEVDPKIKVIASMWDAPQVQQLLMKLKETITLYNALGSHREKIHYKDDIAILSYIYGKILYFIRGDKLPRKFWEGLIRLIHDKTLVDDFNELLSVEVDNELVKDLTRRFRGKISAREIVHDHDVADAYRILRVLLEKDLANPVYRAIMERIEQARREWLSRNIDLPEFMRILIENMEECLRYDEEVIRKPLEGRIVETVNMVLTQKFNLKFYLKLKNLRETVSKVVAAPRLATIHESRIKTALLKDLLKEAKKALGDIPGILVKLTELSEKLTKDYIIPEIRRAKESEGYAA